jgi:hypothetical protein
VSIKTLHETITGINQIRKNDYLKNKLKIEVCGRGGILE